MVYSVLPYLFLLSVSRVIADDCPVSQQVIVRSVNSMAVNINLAADALYIMSGHEKPLGDDGSVVPVFTLSDSIDERGLCMRPPPDIGLFDIKLNAVLDALQQDAAEISVKGFGANSITGGDFIQTAMSRYRLNHSLPDSSQQSYIQAVDLLVKNIAVKQTRFREMIHSYRTTVETVAKLTLPPPVATEFGLSEKDREFLATRHHFPFYRRGISPRLHRALSGRNRTARELIESGKLVLPTLDVSLEIPRSRQRWPSYSNADLLRRYLGDSPTNATSPLCTITELRQARFDRSAGFVVKTLPRSEFEKSFGAYRMTLHVAGFEQLRYYCHLEPDNFLVVTENPGGVSLSDIYQAYDTSRNVSAVTEPWQKVVALRIRQNLEMLEALGWIHERPVYRLDLDLGAFPVLMNLNECTSVETLAKTTKNPKLASVVQMRLFLGANHTDWSNSFPAGSTLLLDHVSSHLREMKASA